MNTQQHIKFPSIEQFRNVKRNIEIRAQYAGFDESGQPILNLQAPLPVLKFVGTEKIHGSCCSVQWTKENIVCQSRERIITLDDDNYGFVKFIHTLPASCFPEQDIVLHGEYAGKGIQKHAAICAVEKFWVIFAVEHINSSTDEQRWINISDWKFCDANRVFNIFDNKTWEIDIDFNDADRLAEAVETINNITLDVEKESPLGLKLGVSGIGEGLVWRCVTPGWGSSKYWFKTKGEKHAKKKIRKLATVDVEKVNSVAAFIEKHVNEERLQQGWDYLHENNLFNYEKSMGDFLRWLAHDILKEEADELVASGLEKKDVGSAIAIKGRKWYITKMG